MKSLPNIDAGLNHIKRRLRPGAIDKSVSNFLRLREAGEGKGSGPLLNLTASYKARALLSWFSNHDLKEAKLNAYVAGRLRTIYEKMFPSRLGGSHASYIFYPLLSDNVELLHWEKQYFAPLFIKGKNVFRCMDLSTHEFQSLQFRLALAGDWELLVERAERFLDSSVDKFKLYRIDNEIYLALAEGDSQKVKVAIENLLLPQVARYRNKELEWGLEEKFLSAWAFMFSKLARIHGVNLDIESPWVPQEWLAVSPLDRYSDPHPFIGDFELYGCFDSGKASNLLDIAKLSPRPMSEPPLTFLEALEIVSA